jgi:hypothetical protein
MVEIQAIPTRGRVMVVYRGQVLAAELEEAERQLHSALPVLAPAFDVVCDISAAEPLEPEAMVQVRRMADLLLRPGCAHVRVVGRSGQTASVPPHRALGGYESRLAFSRDEAEALLDGPG